MTELTPDLSRRILFILHHGMVEARNLAYAGRAEQIADLADAMEYIPGLMMKWKEDSMEALTCVLKTYQDKYPDHYEYVRYLDEYPVHDWY